LAPRQKNDETLPFINKSKYPIRAGGYKEKTGRT
jgi:hypothetical protein